MTATYTAVFEESEGWITAWVEELPGAISQERTIEEARESLREAIGLILESRRAHAWAFVQWQLQGGYALIKTVAGFRHTEGRNVDQAREKTRKGAKKAEAPALSAKSSGCEGRTKNSSGEITTALRQLPGQYHREAEVHSLGGEGGIRTHVGFHT